MKWLLLLVIITPLFVGCLAQQSDAPQSATAQIKTGTAIFPDLPSIDRTVYENIQNICREHWQLDIMKMNTFNILPDRNEYLVECDGIVDGELYHYVIRTNSSGEWINDGRTKKTP